MLADLILSASPPHALSTRIGHVTCTVPETIESGGTPSMVTTTQQAHANTRMSDICRKTRQDTTLPMGRKALFKIDSEFGLAFA
jgi:hypothetical protein